MFLAWLYDKMPMIDLRLVAYSLNVEHGTNMWYNL